MVSKINSFPKQKIRAVVISGSRDFGRCPLASRLPSALWLIAGTNVLENLLMRLADQGIEDVVVCSGQDKTLLSESMRIDKSIRTEFLDEPLPVGTAGCLREAGRGRDDSLYVLVPSSLINPPDFDALIDEHIQSKSDLTVVFEPVHSGNCKVSDRANGIYICCSSALEFIPPDGYFDIKEGLIPRMLRAGKNIHAVTLTQQSGTFRNRYEYLYAVSNNIRKIAENNGLKLSRSDKNCILWSNGQTHTDPSAIISGEVILMEGARISEDAIIIGPAILGSNVSVGRDSIINKSVLWDNAVVMKNCSVENCVLDCNTNLFPFTNVAERCIENVSGKLLNSSNSIVLKNAKNKLEALRHIPAQIKHAVSETIKVKLQKTIKYTGVILILSAFAWSYWDGIRDLWDIWMRSDEYSSGFLVPFLAAYILWLRRQEISQVPLRPSIAGLFLFIFAQALRIFGMLFLFGSAERLSIVISIAAIVLFLFGRKLFVKVSTILLFLFLMLPWPNRVQSAVSLPLQSISTSSAVFCLQVLGFDIIREGNVIHIGNATVAVAEACNGLRMITAFFVISALVALLVSRKWWEKLIVLVSSLPVAFLCNTLRLSITSIMFTFIKGPYWEKVFHDFGGYAMMPLAIAFIVAELWLIDRLTIPPEENNEIIIVREKR